MPKKQIATPEAVAAAVEKLTAEGLEPTLERVRAKLGGGSYTTINRALAEVMQARQSGPAKLAEIPADLIEIGQKAVAAIYTAVQRQTMATIESIEGDARRQIEAAQAARAEAGLEIERLESELESSADSLEQARLSMQEASSRAERSEARGELQQSELKRLASDLLGSQTEVESLRGRLREAEMQARQAEQDAHREAEALQRALTRAEAGLEAAQDRSQRDAESMRIAQLKIEGSQSLLLAATSRAERAEASAEALNTTLDNLRGELASVRESERGARDEAAEAKGQLRECRDQQALAG